MLHCVLSEVIGLGLETYRSYVGSCGRSHSGRGSSSHFIVFRDGRHIKYVKELTNFSVIGVTFCIENEANKEET